MVRGVDTRRDVEPTRADPKVRTQIGRHRVERAKKAWEDLRPRLSDRILGIGQIERGLARVEVDRRLHAVADVVHVAPLGRVGVREVRARGVAINDVAQTAIFADHEIRIGVPGDEWGESRDALAHRSTPEQLALSSDLITDQQVQVAESSGEEQAIKEGVQRDARGAAPLRGCVP